MIGPIGVFDSGLGGLSVAREIAALAPQCDLLYLADSARVPYGLRSAPEVRGLTLSGLHFLHRQGVALAVLACGTATATALQQALQQFPFPVVGVFDAAARTALSATRSGRIGLLATPLTVRSGVFAAVVSGQVPSAQVFSYPAPRLVEIVEAGDWLGPAARDAVREYLAPLLQAGVDTLVLGCTHYVHLRHLIEEEAGPGVAVVDPAHETALEAVRQWAALSDRPASGQPASGKRRFFCTGDPDRFMKLAARLWPEAVSSVVAVDPDRWEVFPGPAGGRQSGT